MNKISFKCEDSLWQMLADGSKTFDVRRWDMSDDRIYRLSWGKHQRLSGGDTEWVPDVEFIHFLNKLTGETLTFPYLGVEFVPWAPGWGFLLLGDRVDACHS